MLAARALPLPDRTWTVGRGDEAGMDRKIKGVLCIVSAAACFALQGVFVRLSGDLPSMQKSFFRNFIALLFALALLLRSREKFQWNKKQLPVYLARAVFGTIGILGNYYAIDHLLLSDASMLNKLSPFFAIIFSYFALRETVKPMQVLGILVAFLGALCIIKPGGIGNGEWHAAVIGAVGGMAAGAAYTAVRVLGQRGERNAFIVFFFSAFSCLVCLPFLVFDYHPMSLFQAAMLGLAGLSAAGGQFSVTAAYTYAPAREISVYDYTQVIFSAALGFFLFQQMPDWLSVVGYVLICGVTIVLFFYHNRRLPRGKGTD